VVSVDIYWHGRMPVIMTQKAAACFMVCMSNYNLMAVTGMCLNFDPMPIYSKCSALQV